MGDTKVVEVQNLVQRFGDYTAVDGISFEITRGEVFGLLGTNGAGKTTTMDALCGFRAPTAGTVKVFDLDPATHRDKIKSRSGVVLQEAGFFEWLTVAETINAWRRFTANARSTAEALSMVELSGHARTPIKRLSGGQRRRLDVTLGLLGRPELLFLDEPTTGLDPKARARIWELMRGMVSDGMTVVLTTHYMEEAAKLADRVAIMDRGRIVRQGLLSEVVKSTSNKISFRLGEAEAPLPSLPGASFHRDADTIVVDADNPQQTLSELLSWAADNNLELAELKVEHGSLEDVFMEIASTGKA